MRSALFVLLLFLLTACSNSFSTNEDPPGRIHIGFSLPEDSHVKLWIENSYQTKIITLVNDSLQMGTHVAPWNGLDSEGKPAPTGMYSYHIKANEVYMVKDFIYLPNYNPYK